MNLRAGLAGLFNVGSGCPPFFVRRGVPSELGGGLQTSPTTVWSRTEHAHVLVIFGPESGGAALGLELAGATYKA